MKSSKKNIAYYIAGGIIGSIVIGGLYMMWKKLNKTTLSDYIEEYFIEIQEMMKNNKEKELAPEIIGNIYHLISELEDYLYLVENYDYEEDRLVHYNTEKYRMEFNEMIQFRLKCHEHAVKLAEKRLKFNLNELDEIISNHDLRNVKETLIKSRKPYKKLPNISADNVRKAFILYSKKLKENKVIEDEQMYLNEVTGNSDYSSILTQNIYINNLKVRDEIKVKYNVDCKYLEALVHKYNLLNDNEVKYYYEEKNKIEALSNLFVG